MVLGPCIRLYTVVHAPLTKRGLVLKAFELLLLLLLLAIPDCYCRLVTLSSVLVSRKS